MLQAKLLGQFEIRLDNQTVDIPSRPAQSLFAYLLLHPNRSHRREKLAGQFWPESSDSNARSNLRHALWRIRKAFGPNISTRIVSDDLGVNYHPQPGDQLDVRSFEVYPDNAASTDQLLQAVSVYGGELLPGFYEDWVMLERERLQAAFDRKLGKLLDCLLIESRWNDILEWGERWVASGSIPEPAFRALMLAHAGLGNLASAAAQYQRCVEMLARELGIEPSEQTRKVFMQIQDGAIVPDLPITSKYAPTTPVTPAYLEEPEKPLPVFVEREAELAALDGHLNKALQGQVQVVFVSGEAGSGKTALLQAFLRRSVTAHPDLLIGWGTCNAYFGQGDPYLPFRDVLDMLAGGIKPLYTNGQLSQNQAQIFITRFPLVFQALVEQGPGLVNTFLSSSTLVSRAKAIMPEEKVWNQRIARFITQEPVPIGEQEKSPLFEQYTQVLCSILEQIPLIIFLDDLQWMDPGTGHLLFHLARRLQNTRILIAGAFRVEEVVLGRNGERHPLAPLLNEFKSSFGEILIDLDYTREISGRSFIDAFLDSEPNRLDDTFRNELHRRTHGHPLFAIQMLRNLQERGEIIQDEQERWIASTHLNWGSLPQQVEGIIGERVGRLDPKLQDLLLAASVEGEQFTLQVLERIQGEEKRVILHQLSRELEKRHRLVQELGEIYVGNQRLVRFRFVHTLIQQYMYRQLGTAERTALHQDIAETLEVLYKEEITAVSVPLALHYRKAGVREKAVEYLLQAGDQSRNLYAHQEAIEHYRHALFFLKEMAATEQTARTLMKLYLVYHSSFDFQRAQEALEECNALWQQLSERNVKNLLPKAQNAYRLPILKKPIFDPGLCESLFELEWIKELFCGLVEWSEDRNVIPMAANHWDVLDNGRRYIFKLRQDLLWSDGKPLTAQDFEFAWKRVLDPATNALAANLLYEIIGAKDFHQGRTANPNQIGITAPDPFTLVIELEEPCSYFPYILGDPVSFAVPKHIVEREGDAWTEPGRIVTNGAFRLESWDRGSGKTIHFSRNPHYLGAFKGNIERVTLVFHQNEHEIYQSYVAGQLDMVQFLIPPLKQNELKHYRDLGQLHISLIPFVDAIYFITSKPPFDKTDIRRAFVLATDRGKLARVIENQLPATGGYIPPGLPGHSPDIGLPYNPQEARRILANAGYPQGLGFPPVRLLVNLVGLEKGDNLVFAYLQEMWKENLGVTIQKCLSDSATVSFKAHQGFQLFFLGWGADYPDPASFLQTNFLIDQTGWQNSQFEALIEEGRQTLDQGQRLKLYRHADHLLTKEAAVLPLFYGHITELRQPWVHKPSGSSIYSPQWKDITLMPY